MTSKKVMQTRGRKKFLAAAIPLILAAQAQGVEFNFGEVEMSLDTQLTIGSSWRMEDPSASLIEGLESGATSNQNNNDGDLNFEKGDAFSQVFKGTHDFQISYQNFGAFVRGKYWYDTILEDGNKANIDNGFRDALTGLEVDKADGGAFSDEGGSDYAKFSGAQILDAFVYGEFELGEMPLDIRLGKQVLSWGESTFIQGGINQTNPFDVSALRRPGAELKEGLIPVNMAFASIGLTENLSAETFYQIGHQETVTPHCGTFFSTNDYQPEGCGPVETTAGTISRDPAYADGIKRPSDDGQFGVAFRYFSESLDTEFGLFAMNVHSRVPLVSGTKSTLDELELLNLGGGAVPQGTYNAVFAGLSAQTVAGLNAGLAAVPGFTPFADFNAVLASSAADDGTGANPVTTAAAGAVPATFVGTLAKTTTTVGNPYYYVDYPEDQQIAGLSFATNVGGVAVSGEVTHKLDVPFQINATQLLGAILTADAAKALVIQGAGIPGVTTMAQYDALNDSGNLQLAIGDTAYATLQATIDATVLAVAGGFGVEVANKYSDGDSAGGFHTYDVSQAQVTAIKLFDQVLGANRYALVAEAGYTYVHDFDENGAVRYDGSCSEANDNSTCKDTVTEGSWGYRMRISGDYSDVFAGVNLSPVLSFSHDVEGVAPAPGGNFLEDRKTLGLALNAEYANMYTAGLSYTMYDDRDYAALTLGVQF